MYTIRCLGLSLLRAYARARVLFRYLRLLNFKSRIPGTFGYLKKKTIHKYSYIYI